MSRTIEATGTVFVRGRRFAAVVTSRPARNNHDRLAPSKKSRVFGDAPSPEDLGLMEVPPMKRLGDDPEVDAAWKAYNRLEVKLQREVLDQVWAGGKLSFNRNAGCGSCPCSPGFVASEHTGRNFWVTVKAF